MRRSPNQPPWREDDEPEVINDCFVINFLLNPETGVKIATIARPSTSGNRIFKHFEGDDAADIWTLFTDQEVEF